MNRGCKSKAIVGCGIMQILLGICLVSAGGYLMQSQTRITYRAYATFGGIYVICVGAIGLVAGASQNRCLEMAYMVAAILMAGLDAPFVMILGGIGASADQSDITEERYEHIPVEERSRCPKSYDRRTGKSVYECPNKAASAPITSVQTSKQQRVSKAFFCNFFIAIAGGCLLACSLLAALLVCCVVCRCGNDTEMTTVVPYPNNHVGTVLIHGQPFILDQLTTHTTVSIAPPPEYAELNFPASPSLDDPDKPDSESQNMPPPYQEERQRMSAMSVVRQTSLIIDQSSSAHKNDQTISRPRTAISIPATITEDDFPGTLEDNSVPETSNMTLQSTSFGNTR